MNEEDFSTAESDLEDEKENALDPTEQPPASVPVVNGIPPVTPVIMVDFAIQDEADDEKAQQEARAIKLDFDRRDIKAWLHRLEVRLEWAGVKSQWLKRLCLENMLPQDVANACNDLFGLTKSELTGAKDIYNQCKKRLIKVHGPKPKEDFRKALTIVLTGLPSEAAKEIRALVCEKKPPLKDCCCATQVGAIWESILPEQVKASVAGMDLKNEFDSVIQKADDVYLSVNGGATVKTVAAAKLTTGAGAGAKPTKTVATKADLDTSADQSAFDQMNQLTAQLAAFNKNFKKGGKQRGKGGNRGGGAGRDGPKETPPPDACAIHKRHGKDAYYCLEPSSCPWKDYKAQPK